MIVENSEEDEEIDALLLLEKTPPLIVIQIAFTKMYITLPLDING